MIDFNYVKQTLTKIDAEWGPLTWTEQGNRLACLSEEIINNKPQNISPKQEIPLQQKLAKLRDWDSVGRFIGSLVWEPAVKEFYTLLGRIRAYVLEVCWEWGFLHGSLTSRATVQPLGYTGDFLTIEWIYTSFNDLWKIFPCTEQGRVWDDFFWNNPAACAVRNRKDYFIQLIKKLLENASWEVRILNVASGPATDVLEAYQSISDAQDRLRMTCIDLDGQAIRYAQEKLWTYADRVNFVNRNALKFNPAQEKYDIIWSAGLFDYFTDATMIALLKKFNSWLKYGGSAVVGNFNSENNPSRAYMEAFCFWFLKHRSRTYLENICESAWFSEVRIEQEPLNINLFAHMQKT